MNNKKGSTLVTVIVSFLLLLIVIMLFDKMTSMAGNMAARASTKNRAYEKAYEDVFNRSVYNNPQTAEVTFTLENFNSDYARDKSVSVSCYYRWVQATGDGVTARVYSFSPIGGAAP